MMTSMSAESSGRAKSDGGGARKAGGVRSGHEGGAQDVGGDSGVGGVVGGGGEPIRRELRRLAFSMLFQIDARRGVGLEEVAETETEDEGGRLSAGQRRRAYEMALGAWEHREASDAAMLELAPEWPAARQAAADRAVLRLAHYEMRHTDTPVKVAVNEAVELAKQFGTEKSPGFVNGLLDKILKRVLAEGGAEGEVGRPADDVVG